MQVYNLLRNLTQFYIYKDNTADSYVSDTTWKGSYFELSQTKNILQIRTFDCYRTDSSVSTLNIEVRNDNSGEPGSTIHYSKSFDITHWPISGSGNYIDARYNVDFSLSSGKYWLVFYINTGGDEAARFLAGDSQSVVSDDSGSTWSSGYGPHFSLYE